MMPFRFAFPVMACATLAMPAFAQSEDPEIAYETGQYEYAQLPDDGDDVVTETVPATPEPRPAVRVIPMRRTGPPPVFVPSPVVQVIAPAVAGVGADAQAVARVPAAAPVRYAPARQAAPVIYAYAVTSAAPLAQIAPASGTARAIYPSGAGQPAYAYAPPPGVLPAGAQLVAFDRAIWLAECRNRLAGYAPEQRAAAMAALGGVAIGYTPANDYCAAYLDSWLASAAAGTLAVQPQYGQQYMLVPVAEPVSQVPDGAE